MMGEHRTTEDYLSEATNKGRFLIIEHKRGYDGARERIVFRDVWEVLPSRWVRYAEGETPCILSHDAVKREVSESSAIQLRDQPPFEPEHPEGFE